MSIVKYGLVPVAVNTTLAFPSTNETSLTLTFPLVAVKTPSRTGKSTPSIQNGVKFPSISVPLGASLPNILV